MVGRATTVATPNAVAGTGSETPGGVEIRNRSSRVDFMRDYFAKQDKVQVRLQEDTPVQINGYQFLIQGKTRVLVPVGVAEVLEQAGLI